MMMKFLFSNTKGTQCVTNDRGFISHLGSHATELLHISEFDARNR